MSIYRRFILKYILVLGILGVFSCQETQKSPRIAIAGLAIESSTFSPAQTTAEAFHARQDEDIFDMYPFFEENHPVRKSAKWFPALRGHALPGGIVTRAAYDSLVQITLDKLQKNLPYDGLFFDIHGAMSVVGLEDPEGDFIEKIRAVVGSETLISTSMDLHGNVSKRLGTLSDLITCYRMAPHEDALESKQRAVENLLQRLKSKKGKPKYKAWIPIPILLPGEQTSTRIEPAKSLYAKIPEVVDQEGIIDAAIWVGYPWADEKRNHAVVMVTGDDEEQVSEGASYLACSFWEVRKEFDFVAPTTDFESALTMALNSKVKPFIVSDMGDNPTAGGAGDVTWTLQQLLNNPEFQSEDGPELIYASIPGPELIEKALNVGVGGTVAAKVGAAVDNRYAPPVRLKGKVLAIKKGDRNARAEVVVQSGSLKVIVTEKRKPYHYLKDFTDLDLNPEQTDILMVKIGYLVPELYQIRADWVMALTPGGVDQDLYRLPYKHILRPMYPLDTFEKEPDLKTRFLKSSSK